MALTRAEIQKTYRQRRGKLPTSVVPPALEVLENPDTERFRAEMLAVLRYHARGDNPALAVTAAAHALKSLGPTTEQAFVAMLGGPERALLWLRANRDRLMVQLAANTEGVPRETEQGREAEEDGRGT